MLPAQGNTVPDTRSFVIRLKFLWSRDGGIGELPILVQIGVITCGR